MPTVRTSGTTLNFWHTRYNLAVSYPEVIIGLISVGPVMVCC